MAFALSPAQSALRDKLASAARHCLAFGGARSGKTFAFCYAIAIRALSAPDSRHLIARLHHIDVRTSIMMDTWPRMMRLAFPSVAYKESKADQYITLQNGSEVWFGGLDDKERVEKVLGREYATIYANECSQISYETILTLRTRLAQPAVKVNGDPLALKFYYDLNPLGRSHWTHREFVENVSPVNGAILDPLIRTYAVLNPTDNPHLPRATLEELAALPIRQRQRFYEGRFLSEVPGALWPADLIDKLRCSAHQVPELHRIVVAVDPSGSDGTGGDIQGIITVGIGADDHAYVIHDDSTRKSPGEWAKDAVQRYHAVGADLLVAEVNYGGAMVESTIRTADRTINYKPVTASRGKHVRAEPVAALYEQGKVHHVGQYPELEEQMSMFTTLGFQGSGSPDRADALVWAITELMLGDEAVDWARLAG